jgi:hypothetical protein
MAVQTDHLSLRTIATFLMGEDEFYRSRTNRQILGAGGVVFTGASCAVRMSLALHKAGAHFPIIKNSWKLKGTRVYLPSYAADYKTPVLLGEGERFEWKEQIRGRAGIVFFGGFPRRSGHLTCWSGSQLSFQHEEEFWGQPDKHFWELSY